MDPDALVDELGLGPAEDAIDVLVVVPVPGLRPRRARQAARGWRTIRGVRVDPRGNLYLPLPRVRPGAAAAGGADRE